MVIKVKLNQQNKAKSAARKGRRPFHSFKRLCFLLFSQKGETRNTLLLENSGRKVQGSLKAAHVFHMVAVKEKDCIVNS